MLEKRVFIVDGFSVVCFPDFVGGGWDVVAMVFRDCISIGCVLMVMYLV